MRMLACLPRWGETEAAFRRITAITNAEGRARAGRNFVQTSRFYRLAGVLSLDRAGQMYATTLRGIKLINNTRNRGFIY